MAFQTGALEEVYRDIRNQARDIKSRSQSLRSQSAAGAVNSELIIEWYLRVQGNRAAMAALASTPGLPAYAQAESNDENYDVVAEYTATLAQIDAALAWVTTNFPASGGFLQSHSFNAGVYTPRSFSTASLATFRTVLDSLIATIN